MTIQDFAKTHRLKLTQDDCGDAVVQGKHGQVYEYDDTRLSVPFAIPSKTDPCGRWCPKVWNRLRELARQAGMVVTQNGDSEGVLTFDPQDKGQVKLALQIAKTRTRRVMTPEQAAAGAARLAKHRQNGKTQGKRGISQSRIVTDTQNREMGQVGVKSAARGSRECI